MLPLSTLTNWVHGVEKDITGDGDLKAIKFPIRDDINQKIYLWQGGIQFLDVDAIVNSTNESMNESIGVSGAILDAAGSELLEEITKCDPCRTGEARVTKGYNLPSRFVIHTVGPRYNEKYKTAAENALHNCYRSCLEVLKEQNLKTIAFPVINSQKRGYPPEPGAHIAIRTVRRFLEHWGKDIESVVFTVVNVEEFKLYNRILGLYFPRNKKELITSKEELPRDTGNEFGETVIEERKIRITAFPGMKDIPTSPRPQPAPAPSAPAPVSPPTEAKVPNTFAMMKTDFDEERKKKLENMSPHEKERLVQQQVYINHLYKAQATDLSDIARLNVIYESGKDAHGRPVVVFIGQRLPSERSQLDRVFLYMIRIMDTIVDNNYVMVYVHTNMENKDTPEFSWMKQVYGIMDYKYGDHLSAFYVVHPTFWLKVFEGVISTLVVNDSFWSKVRYVPKLELLYESIDPDQVILPEEVYKYDVKENGVSSRHPVRRGSQAESLVNDL